MHQIIKVYNQIKEKASGYYAERILAQLGYLLQIFEAEDAKIPEDLCNEIQRLHDCMKTDGALTRKNLEEMERTLASYGKKAKQYQLICAAHAHIDMNWQWGTDETIGVVIDTFRTMLRLMEEYPDFVFSQSQAAVYEMIEVYYPSMLDEIKKRVKEGRWEVTASTWVENDKNMSGTEAMLRHLLYTKTYLSELLDLDPESLDLDFEPDTFGHCAHLPQILQAGGVKYYYHCRGNDRRQVYRWQDASGDELLVNCESDWYLGPILYDMAAFVPGWCRENHTHTALKVYGVGDHGGGPTRRDIERIRDMATWPLMPKIRFGTIREFFKELEKHADLLPLKKEEEQNFIFTGCYTSQSRIKQANRMGEDHLQDCEALSAMSILAGGSCGNPTGFETGWRGILFNQFHDILPGSCVREARECALGTARKANGYALGNAKEALEYLGGLADTSVYGIATDAESTAEGAGAGYHTVKSSAQERAFAGTVFGVTGSEQGGGKLRAYTFFNTTQYARKETVELTIWDWPLDLRETAIKDGKGNQVSFEVIQCQREYWRHMYDKIAFTVEVPAFGYATYYIMEAEETASIIRGMENPRVKTRGDEGYVLENDQIYARFEPATMRLVSLIQKSSNTQLLSAPAGFRMVYEMDNPMTSWVVGDYSKVVDLNQECDILVTEAHLEGDFQWISYEMPFAHSVLKVRISLGSEDCVLRCSTEVDFHEIGDAKKIPQLQLYVPYAYEPQGIRYDVPGGAWDRKELYHDVPAIRYAAPIPKEGCALVLTTDCKYGYRACENALILDLLRASTNPDRYPELGVHQMELGIGVAKDADWKTLTRIGTLFAHPLYAYSNRLHTGILPQEHSFLQVEGEAEVLAVKPSREGVVLRLANWGSADAQVMVSAADKEENMGESDLYEVTFKPLERTESGWKVTVPHHKMKHVRIDSKVQS